MEKLAPRAEASVSRRARESGANIQEEVVLLFEGSAPAGGGVRPP